LVKFVVFGLDLRTFGDGKPVGEIVLTASNTWLSLWIRPAFGGASRAAA